MAEDSSIKYYGNVDYLKIRVWMEYVELFGEFESNIN
jgi:hypothetical protein